MILYIKNGSLLTKRFKCEELVDITHEAERYLFDTTIDCSEAIVGDLFEILNKNETLRKIFTEKRTEVYKDYNFGSERLNNAVLKDDKSLKKFINHYKDKTREEIQKEIDNCNVEDVELKEIELEITYELNSISSVVDMVGIGLDETRYSLSLSSIDKKYFIPLVIRYYKEVTDDETGEEYFEQFDGQISTLKFFHEIFKNLDEMILENNREDVLFSPEDFNQS